MLVILGVALPLIALGRKFQNRIVGGIGFTVSVSAFAALQLLRPLAANVYALAAYRLTEMGKNDIWTKYPTLAPAAFVSKAATAKSNSSSSKKA